MEKEAGDTRLWCHQCSSFETDECNDPFVFERKEGEEVTVKYNDYFLPCEPIGPNKTAPTICRKIYQNGE